MRESLRMSFEKKVNDAQMEKLRVEFPLYMNCYREALSTVLKNIERNLEEEQRVSVKYKDGRMKYKDDSNIIAFIGKRGSGKTTALRGFGRILEKYPDAVQAWNKELAYKNSREIPFCFHMLPVIDASVLDEKEDLLELIWSEMYRLFRERGAGEGRNFEWEDKLKKIIRSFDEVYKNYNNINHREHKEIIGESVLIKLQQAASSEKARSVFGDLVKDLLEMLDGRERKESYLVITVDDLDVNLNKGYEMLEQIHKYLCNPRVIVLIAIDFEQMSMLCEKKFADSLTIPVIDGVLEKNAEEKLEKAQKMCRDYLLKIIPLDRRIYQPTADMIAKQIYLTENSKTEHKPESEKTKEHILKKIAMHLQIYYDAKGLKKHFAIPETVRALTNYENFLNSMFTMEEIEQQEDKELKMQLYDRNYEWYHQDVIERMAIELLNSDQLKKFHLIEDRSMERRGEYAVVFLNNWMVNKYKTSEKRLIDSIDGINYHYGDLLKQIYHLGREDFYDKVLVHCLLAAFTSEMVREHFRFINGSEEEREESRQKLLSFRGTTFGGAWFNYLTVPRSINNNQYLTYVEYENRVHLDQLLIQQRFEVKSGEKNIDEWLSVLTSLIPCIECLTMLFSNYRNEDGVPVLPEWTYEFRESEEEDKKEILELRIRNKAPRADFDIFGFIGKEIEQIDYAKAVRENWVEAVTELTWKKKERFGKQWKDKKGLKKLVENKVSQCSIFSQKAGQELSFPYYNFDLSYNVMKRVRRDMRELTECNVEHMLDYLRKVYKIVGERLREQDEFYEKQNTLHPEFERHFRENAVVKAILENKKWNEKFFNNMFLMVVETLNVPDVLSMEE